jgi:hypothetical protein
MATENKDVLINIESPIVFDTLRGYIVSYCIKTSGVDYTNELSEVLPLSSELKFPTLIKIPINVRDQLLNYMRSKINK